MSILVRQQNRGVQALTMMWTSSHSCTAPISHQGAPRQVEMEMWNWKAIDVVNAHVRRHRDLMSSMKIGLDLMAVNKFSFVPLITHRFGLDGVDDAYTALLEKPSGFVKAVIVP